MAFVPVRWLKAGKTIGPRPSPHQGVRRGPVEPFPVCRSRAGAAQILRIVHVVFWKPTGSDAAGRCGLNMVERMPQRPLGETSIAHEHGPWEDYDSAC